MVSTTRNGRSKTRKSEDAKSKQNDLASSAVRERQQWLETDAHVAMNTDAIPSLPLEDYEVAPERADKIADRSGGSTAFGWIGIGQAGGRIARAFHQLGYGKVLAINSSPHDLDVLDVPKPQKLLMDVGYSGHGKGMERGRVAASQYRQQVLHMADQIFGKGVDHAMIAVGAGGGTGSGATMGVIDALRAGAKRLGFRRPRRKIGVVCSLPTAGEAASPRVRDNASWLVNQLSELAREGVVSPLIFVDNDKVQRLYPGMTVKDFWPNVNDTVAGLFHMFNRLSALPSPYTSFDPDDYRAIMQAGGCTVMGLTKLDQFVGRDDLSHALRHNLDKTLLADGMDLTTAKQVGAIVVGGQQIMAETPGLQDLINRAFDVLTDLTGQATVHRGIYEDRKQSLRVYTIISGLEPPMERFNELADTE